MTDREIRAMLRAATAARFLDGWQGPHTSERSYCIAPVRGDATEHPLAYVLGYVRALEAAGIQPLYRDSEPEGTDYA